MTTSHRMPKRKSYKRRSKKNIENRYEYLHSEQINWVWFCSQQTAHEFKNLLYNLLYACQIEWNFKLHKIIVLIKFSKRINKCIGQNASKPISFISYFFILFRFCKANLCHSNEINFDDLMRMQCIFKTQTPHTHIIKRIRVLCAKKERSILIWKMKKKIVETKLKTSMKNIII